MDFTLNLDGQEVARIQRPSYEEAISAFGQAPVSLDIDLRGAKTLSFNVDIKGKRYFSGAVIILNNGVLTSQP